jgi:hypothetical protein
MKFDWFTSLARRLALGICFLCMTMLSACAKSTVAVSLHGVNYSGETFSYVVVDPSNPKNTGGGGLIDAYSASGTVCCINLPKNWHAGMKLTVESIHWLGKLADKTLREVPRINSVDVPQYKDGKPGELWVLRSADGTISLVSSDFQPDHPKWPGEVKGWPVPSLAFQREQWDKYIDYENGGVKLYDDLLGELRTTPAVTADAEWKFAQEHDKKSVSEFSGPLDPKFREFLRLKYEEGLRRSRQQLDRLSKERP